MTAPHPTFQVALIAVVAAAAIYDSKYRKIPNWLNLSGLILGFGLNTFVFGSAGLISSGEGMLLAVTIYLPLYLIKGMGAGDVKLMAALGALVGPSNWFAIFLATSLLGGAAAALFALLKGRWSETCWNVLGILDDLAHLRLPYRTNSQMDVRSLKALRMPHGVTIAIGCAAFLLLSAFPLLELLP